MMKDTLRASACLLAIAAAGMCPAVAADMYRAPESAGGYKDGPVPYVGWTGFYAGVHVGAVWGRDDVSPVVPDGGTFPRTNRLDSTDAFGGGTLGYNFQRGNFVFGIEGDGGPMNISKSRLDPPIEIDNITKGQYADITGRLGYTFGRALLYAKGGFAAYDGEGKVTDPGFAVKTADTFTGWTAGGGAEYKISPAVSVKVEYLHFDFGSHNSTLTGVAGVFPYKHELTADTAKLGINYHWLPAYEPLK